MRSALPKSKTSGAAALKRRLVIVVEVANVVVGKAAEIRPLLAKYGTWQEKKITDPDF